jgi:hypothetical protein
MRWRSGVTTVEVMVMLLAISLVIFASYGAQISGLQSYREIVHRERAQLAAAEILEQLEAIRLTFVQINYATSWDEFLGDGKSDGLYEIIPGQGVQVPEFSRLPESATFSDTDVSRVIFYDDAEDDYTHDFSTRLERRLKLTTLSSSEKLMEVSMYWGIPGAYSPESSQQIVVQALYRDHRQPGFSL